MNAARPVPMVSTLRPLATTVATTRVGVRGWIIDVDTTETSPGPARATRTGCIHASHRGPSSQPPHSTGDGLGVLPHCQPSIGGTRSRACCSPTRPPRHKESRSAARPQLTFCRHTTTGEKP